MSREDLLLLIGGGESSSVEFVKDFRSDAIPSIGKTVSAFLNCGGGYIVAGVFERGGCIMMCGEFDFTVGFSEFEKALRQRISPMAPIFFEKIEAEGMVFYCMSIPQGSMPPYAFDGDIYIRTGTRNTRAKMSDIRELVLRSEEHQDRWESRFAVPSISECADLEELRRAISDCEKVERIRLLERTTESVLGSLGLIRFGRLLNAGVLMFATHPGHWLPQVKMRLVAFKSDKTDDFEDAHLLDGPLCDVIDKAEAFIKTNSRKPGLFSKVDGNRTSGYVYPPIAVREALVNACAHREYSSVLGGVSVMLYPGRLEIWNSGSLPEGVTIEGLNALKGQPSVLQNPMIANALYLRGYMEQTGRGSAVIPEECRKFGLPHPVWRYSQGYGVTLIFHNAISASVSKAGTNLGELKREVEKIISENQGISRKYLVVATHASVRSVQRVVDELIREKRVISRGNTRSQGYHIAQVD